MKRRFPVETNLDYTDVKSQNLRNIILVYLPVHILTAHYINNKTIIIIIIIIIIQFNFSFINVLV